jgi:Thiamine pyrophosphate enzyme, N-terminal TPP binding domain
MQQISNSIGGLDIYVASKLPDKSTNEGAIEMNGATALVSMLSDYGVEVIFGVPGDTNVALYEALRTTRNAPRHILCRDERSAVFMADCCARLSGKPGVAEVPSGAGALYGLPGVAEANKSSVPLILLVNNMPQPGVGRGTLTELPVEELFKPLCKRAEALGHIAKLPELIRRAFREATGGRPGAVVLALPEDILYLDLPGGATSLHVEAQCRYAPSSRSRPSDGDLDAARHAILAAKRPLIAAARVSSANKWSEANTFMQGFEPPACTFDSAGQRRTANINAVTGKNLRLPIERGAIAIIVDQQLGKQRRPRQATGDRPFRHSRLHPLVAPPASVLWAVDAYDPKLGRYPVEHLTNHVKGTSTAGANLTFDIKQDVIAWQMIRQVFTPRLRGWRTHDRRGVQDSVAYVDLRQDVY